MTRDPEAPGGDWEPFLYGFEAAWCEEQNPAYVWAAVEICTQTRFPLPEWVNDYLRTCAQRVLDARFDRSKVGVRELLPEIFGFTSGRGPGHLAAARKQIEQEQYAIAFAIQIWRGKDPVEARAGAAAAVGGSTAANADRNRRRWLEDIFKIEGDAPKDTAAWQRYLRTWFRGEIWRVLVHPKVYICDLISLGQLMRGLDGNLDPDLTPQELYEAAKVEARAVLVQRAQAGRAPSAMTEADKVSACDVPMNLNGKP